MRHPVVTVDPHDVLSDVVGAILESDVQMLVVVSPEGVVGTISERDIVIATMTRVPTKGVESPDVEDTIDSSPNVGLQSETYSTQGVCEVCGSLSRDLVEQHGQMLCEDCLAM